MRPTRCLSTAVTAFAGLVSTVPPAAGQGPEPPVDSIFAEWDKPDSPGCALGVARDGRLIYGSGYGMANLETGTPITPRTVFYLASVSKQFTAAALALLALEGRVSLDDDVRRYVRELPDYGRPITLRQLVHHTSGLRDYLALMELAALSLEQPRNPEEILALVARQEATNFPPGEQYLYSNTGYFLIPIIVQRVTGQPIRAFAHERILAPLGMRDTHFHDDHTHVVPNRALSYRRDTLQRFELAFLDKFDQVGSGGVLSTVEDLARWDRNLSAAEVGGRALLDLMHTRGALSNGDTLDYAFGLRIGEYKGVRVVGHGGSMMGFKTELLRFPDQRLSVICLCNLDEIDPGKLARRVAEVYLRDTFAARLAQYAGRYDSRELAVTWLLTVEGADLVVQREGERPVALEARDRDAFALPRGPTLTFGRDAQGRVSGFTLDAGRVRGVRFVRRPGGAS